ncbi:MAG: hypothetical protein L0177_08130, partial [Chloroflexi bacterium]|nr:hypothetical protein [Chloroflexota bacterium]
MSESSFLDSVQAPHVTHLDFDGLIARVETNDLRLHEGVCAYFEPFLADEAPHAVRIVGVQGEAVYDADALLDVPRITSLPKAAFYLRGDILVIYKKRSGVVDYVRGDDFYVVGDI